MKKGLSKFLQFRVNIYICRILGWWLARHYLILLGYLYFFLNGLERKKITQSVENVFGGRQSREEICRVCQSVFQGIMVHYFEKLYNAYSSTEMLKRFFNRNVQDCATSVIKAELVKQKGVLLVTGHFGGVEFMPCFLGARGFPVTIVVRFASDHLRRTSLRRAAEFGIQVIDVDHTPNILRTVFGHLKENRVVITQCDEIDTWKPSRQNATVFLGKCIRRDRAIDIMVRRGCSAIVFALMQRSRPGRYCFTARSQQDMIHAFQGASRLSIGELVLKVLEQNINQHPEQWYQWKKYLDIEALPSGQFCSHRPLTLPLLTPSFGETS